jgi:hypothetical protein
MKYFSKRLSNTNIVPFIIAIFISTLNALFIYFISTGIIIINLEYLVPFLSIAALLTPINWIVTTDHFSYLKDIINKKNINIFNYICKKLDYKLKMGSNDLYMNDNIKDKQYNAMDIDDNSDKQIENTDNLEVNNRPLDKGKGKEVDTGSTYPKGQLLPGGIDPASIQTPSTNPGPGFNVPGGKVPILDPICKHIDYNSHILSQLRSMSLEAAIQQRDNNLVILKVLNDKLAYAQNALSKIPEIPTNDHYFRLKNHILSDIEQFNKDKIRAEARLTLINSRLEFINSAINK